MRHITFDNCSKEMSVRGLLGASNPMGDTGIPTGTDYKPMWTRIFGSSSLLEKRVRHFGIMVKSERAANRGPAGRRRGVQKDDLRCSSRYKRSGSNLSRAASSHPNRRCFDLIRRLLTYLDPDRYIYI